ncbi:hypothetical protein BN903_2 [Halorubrum sp. AJ67]|nr:hypothetical protein BN903_2 [Halorubrum sp. AJ67]
MIPVHTQRDIKGTIMVLNDDQRSNARVASGADLGKSMLAHDRRHPADR